MATKKAAKKKDALGQFEQLVLSSVLACRDDASGMNVHAKVEEFGERKVKVPSVYVTLDRLTEKGYVESWLGNASPDRGNKRARFYRMRAAGHKALADSAAVAQRLMAEWKLQKWFKPAK